MSSMCEQDKKVGLTEGTVMRLECRKVVLIITWSRLRLQCRTLCKSKLIVFLLCEFNSYIFSEESTDQSLMINKMRGEDGK